VQIDEFFHHEVAYPFPPEAEPASPETAGAEDEQPSPEAEPFPGATPAVPAGPPPSAGTGEAETARAIGRHIPPGGGVYLLTDAEDRLVQLGSAGDLRHALRTRLAAAPPPVDPASPARPRARLGEIVRHIRWRTAYSMFEVDYQYWRISRILMPDDYLDNLAFGPAWFVRIDPDAAIPRFFVVKRLDGESDDALGPFATQADAHRFVQILQDAFDLCRYEHILEQAPAGKACAYFEMGRCPAPCDGTVPMADYRATVKAALAFARGDRSEFYQELETRMRQAAEALAFERAATLKQRLERARGIEHAAFRRVRPAREFNYIVIQRDHGRTRVKPFFVRGGVIHPGDPVRLRQLDGSVPRWLDRMHGDASGGVDHASGQEREDGQRVSEQVWLVSHYLHKRDPPGLFLHRDDCGPASELPDRIRERFRPVRNQEPSEETPGAGAPTDQL
jgi:excinuclease UvrABC nuclease subunit